MHLLIISAESHVHHYRRENVYIIYSRESIQIQMYKAAKRCVVKTLLNIFLQTFPEFVEKVTFLTIHSPLQRRKHFKEHIYCYHRTQLFSFKQLHRALFLQTFSFCNTQSYLHTLLQDFNVIKHVPICMLVNITNTRCTESPAYHFIGNCCNRHHITQREASQLQTVIHFSGLS